ncbi:MAG: hypothetical protein GY801_40980, partial [bacterium]|nr:hypothetical protein [bacterium]
MKMLGLSLLLHVALIAFIPGFGIFLPTGDIPYIEIETILLNPKIGEEPEIDFDSETGEDAQGEFVVQPELSVSEPDRHARPDLIGEWERSVLEREARPPEMPKAEEQPENRPSIDPKALAVHIELQRRASKSSPELTDSFERPEPVTADDVTKNAVQPFDIAALRGEDPPLEAEPEFVGRELPELSEDLTFLQSLTLAQPFRALDVSPDSPPLRALQQKDESQRHAPKTAAESTDGFERPEPVTADDVTKSAEQPFDIVALRGEDPPLEAEPEFTGRELPELPENRAFLQSPQLTSSSRTLLASSASPPVRAFQQKDEAPTEMPVLQLPERPVLPEAEEENFLAHDEEPRRLSRADVLPDSDELPDFQARSLSEVVTPHLPAVIPEKPNAEFRPAIAAEPLPQRNFRQKIVEKRAIEPLHRLEPSFPLRDDSIADAEIRRTLPERHENVVVSQQEDEEPSLPFSSKNLAERRSKPAIRSIAIRSIAIRSIAIRSTTPLNAVRVRSEFDEADLSRFRPELRAALAQEERALAQATDFERPAPPERVEEIVGEAPPELR